MVGCPKFDDAQGYIEKFAQIFSNASVKSVTVVVMEVPCCAGLPMIVKRGNAIGGQERPDGTDRHQRQRGGPEKGETGCVMQRV